jgi:hypothetical protein
MKSNACSMSACCSNGSGVEFRAGVQNRLHKNNLDLIVVADETEAVVTKLNAALDRLEEGHAHG